jgi:hypothetical protein
MKVIDNLEVIKDILVFNNPNDFYQLYIMVRRKDFPESEKKLHKEVRVIKSYCIDSIEYLESRWDEIKKLANFFSGRVYIEVNPKNHMEVSFRMLKELGDRFERGLFRQNGIFDITAGSLNSKLSRWVIDIDIDDLGFVKDLIEYIEGLEPLNKGNKVLACLPTRNGYHLITNRFDTRSFSQEPLLSMYKNIVDIKKDAPTLIYY